MARREILLIATTIFVTICAGFSWRHFRTKVPESPREALSESWNGDISSISGREFWRQLGQNGMIQQKSWPTVFRSLGGSPSEEILPWLNGLDLKAKVLLDGPHIETISMEGSLVRHEPLIQSIYAFRRKEVDLFVLRQKTYVKDPEWGTYALVQDKRVTLMWPTSIEPGRESLRRLIPRIATSVMLTGRGPSTRRARICSRALIISRNLTRMSAIRN
jgi:hypothetical protein